MTTAIQLLEEIIAKSEQDDRSNPVLFTRAGPGGMQIGESWNTFHLKQLRILLENPDAHR